MPLKPPPDIEPQALFELLSERRPTWPLDVRFDDAPETKLHAQALTPTEWAHVRRDGKAVILYGLCTSDGRVYNSLADVAELRSSEAKRLADGLMVGLDACSPTWGRIDWPLWERELMRGAELSGSIAKAWDDCVDIVVGPRGAATIERPERFWGCPVAEVLDGHKMAMRVARRLADARRSQ